MYAAIKLFIAKFSAIKLSFVEKFSVVFVISDRLPLIDLGI